jgi:hypothetical protein
MSFGHKQELGTVIGDTMSGTGEHYVKWNKPGTERQVLHVLAQILKLKKLISLSRESKVRKSRGEERRVE